MSNVRVGFEFTSLRRLVVAIGSPALIAGLMAASTAGIATAAPGLGQGLAGHMAPDGDGPRIERVAVFGPDDRTPVPRHLSPLKDRIGILFNSSARTLCTAFCVAPNVVASAAHCLFRRTEQGQQPLSNFWFEVRGSRGKQQTQISGIAHGAAMQNIIAGTVNLRVRPPIDAANDWALVRLEEPLCRGRTLPLREVRVKDLERAARRGRVFQVSYHRDYEKWQLAYSRPCQVRRQYRELPWRQIRQEFTNPENLVLHQCDTAGASSGSPLLLDAAGGPYAVGINVGTYVQSRVPIRSSGSSPEETSRTIANTGVSAAAFARHVRMLRDADVIISRAEMSRLQLRLRELNLYGGTIDGLFGNMTRLAIQAFERSNRLPETGLPTRHLLDTLNKRPPLPSMKRLRSVEHWQTVRKRALAHRNSGQAKRYSAEPRN